MSRSLLQCLIHVGESLVELSQAISSSTVLVGASFIGLKGKYSVAFTHAILKFVAAEQTPVFAHTVKVKAVAAWEYYAHLTKFLSADKAAGSTNESVMLHYIGSLHRYWRSMSSSASDSPQ